MQKLIVFSLLLLSANTFSQNSSLNVGEVNSKNYYTEIKFEFVNNKIIIPVEIDGKTYRFIVDTGAPNIISNELFESIKTKLIEEIPVSDANGIKKNINVVSVKQLKIGHVNFNDTATLVYDINANAISKCFGVDGFIGSNMLRNSILQIDLNNKILRLTDNKKRLDLNNNDSADMALIGIQSKPYIWITLGDFNGEGEKKEAVLIDTGMGDLYDLPLKHYNNFGGNDFFKELGKSTGASDIGAFGDPVEEEHLRLLIPKLTVNNLEINNAVTVTSNGQSSNLGTELLKYGIMTIDFQNKKFYFEPTSNKIDVRKAIMGVSPTLKNGAFVVGFVWDEKLKDTIAYGDKILKVNEKTISKSTICDLATQESLILKDASQLKLTIQNKKGEIFDLLIEKKLPMLLRKAKTKM